MSLVIKTTGLEQYAPGGEARLKLLIIGGSGSGKTRWASFFPRPIYADCEAGLASVADRNVPYVSVHTSGDMLDLLTFLKQESRQPRQQRSYDTVVIDTLDAYQRKLKAEWMDRERKEAFTGWEAWGFMNQKMQLLLTRLLNLDMNVVVAAHYKDKTTKDDDTGRETHELMLQLQGETADTAFNDFDQVGWMGTYWEAVAGERIQKRGLTFKPTPDKPFLKDRLNVTSNWMEVTFADTDYQNLLACVTERIDVLIPGETVGQIPTADPAADRRIVRPDQVNSGPLPPQPPVEVPLSQMDKPSLAKRARELGIATLPDGAPIKGNTLKAELIAAIEHHLAQPTPTAEQTPPSTDDTTVESSIAVTGPSRQVPNQASPPVVEEVSEGLVDTSTGELLNKPPEPPTTEQAVEAVADKLGGEVIAETTPAAREALARRTVAKPAAKPAAAAECEDCNGDLSGENPDYVKLAWIKYRKRLCQPCYMARKSR